MMTSLKPTQLRDAISKHKLATILAVGITVRLILMPITAHPADVYIWFRISENITNNPFNLQGFPPLWYQYILTPLSYFYNWTANFLQTGPIPACSLSPDLNFYPSLNVQYVPGFLFNFLVKTPFLLSDIIVCFFLYKIIIQVTGNRSLAESAIILWFLNPYLIWVSAGWGMWDTLPALFSLIAFFFVLRKRFMLSAFFLSIGFATKIYPALFIVPIAIYILKLNPIGERWKSVLKFFGAFLLTSFFLFLPYIKVTMNLFIELLLPAATNVMPLVVDPITNPVGFGLSYWSLYLINRFTLLPIDISFIFFVSFLSIFMGIMILTGSYWRIRRFHFQNPLLELNTAFLISIGALFLSYRFVSEQFLVWALPSIIILTVMGHIGRKWYWGLSFIALLYTFLNLPMPFFFLPLSPWFESNLLSIVYFFWKFDTLRIIILIILGCLFSVFFIGLILKLLKNLRDGK